MDMSIMSQKLSEGEILQKTNDFIKHDKFVNKKWKGAISEKIKAKTCFADKDLSSWTGLGRPGNVQSQNFGSISYVSGPKLNF